MFCPYVFVHACSCWPAINGYTQGLKLRIWALFAAAMDDIDGIPIVSNGVDKPWRSLRYALHSQNASAKSMRLSSSDGCSSRISIS